ncbi:MAG: YbaB/EbfC family nucleoid-associated protein [Oscillospiraceae bacterium]|nr:YbaB/EbfC family nucleoid-associated protein [Oscillospiraceae bacterium]
MRSRIPKQFQGGGQDMNSMIHQAKKMQDQIAALQEDIEGRTFSASAGGGAVNVVVTGKKTVQSIELKPEVVTPDDIEMLQDLIISAVNEAINTVEETTEKEMSKITGGVALPGLF